MAQQPVTRARAGRSVSDTWFASWTRDILDNPKLATHGAARVGRMRSEVQDFLKSKGVDLPNDGIDVTDDRLLHMNREGKPLSKRVPPELIERIPEALRNPNEVLWDGKSLLYVRHLEGKDVVKAANPAHDRNRAKFVVKVDVDADFQRGDKRVHRQGNWVRSAGRVATGDLKSLERVWP